MAERKQKPVWVRSFHPADTEKNLDALYESLEVLLPDYPVITKDLDDAVEVDDGAHTFDLTVADATRGTLTYQWQKKTTGDYVDISGATSVDLVIASWNNTNDAGTYRCKITNTLNGVTTVTYSNECVATTKMPDPILITLDLPNTKETAEGAECKFDLTVAAVTNGTLAYQWQKKTTGDYVDISGATSVDYTISVWAEATHTGTYRCKITNTFNNDVITAYSNECAASTAAS